MGVQCMYLYKYFLFRNIKCKNINQIYFKYYWDFINNLLIDNDIKKIILEYIVI